MRITWTPQTPRTDAPKTHRVTVEEYDRMIEAGVFAPDARLELVNGRIVSMSPIGPKHMFAVTRLPNVLVGLFGSRVLICSQNPVRLPEDSEPVPDVMLLQLEGSEERLPLPAEVVLLVEVADSSLEFDRTEKLRDYAEAGIHEYWIRNLIDDTFEVYRDPDGARHATTFTVHEHQPVACLALPNDPISW